MKPYVICHMNASVDGRILGSPWRPVENRMPGLFERLHEQLGGGSWLIGRVTGSEYARAKAYPDHTDQAFPREPWFARRDAAAYGIALDALGKIAWGRSDIGGDPIVVVLTERSPTRIWRACARMAFPTSSPASTSSIWPRRWRS
jgi:hypothetical protein